MQTYAQGIIRGLDTFSALKADGGFSIELIRSTERSIAISVHNFDPDDVIISNRRQTLCIYPAPGGYHNFTVNIQVKFIQLSGLDLTGSTNIICHDSLVAGEFTIEQSGSGIVQLDKLHARKLSVRSHGSGRIILAGEAAKAVIHVNGSGLVDTSHLAVKSFNTKVKGSGAVVNSR
jgi:hypothetical protein